MMDLAPDLNLPHHFSFLVALVLYWMTFCSLFHTIQSTGSALGKTQWGPHQRRHFGRHHRLLQKDIELFLCEEPGVLPPLQDGAPGWWSTRSCSKTATANSATGAVGKGWELRFFSIEIEYSWKYFQIIMKLIAKCSTMYRHNILAIKSWPETYTYEFCRVVHRLVLCNPC